MKRLATAAFLNLGLILALIPAAAPAKDKKAGDPPPAVFQAVIDCRAIGEASARLACYDAKVASLADAQKSDDLFVASKAQVREARRGLFGLSLPNFGLFGGTDDGVEAIKEIDSNLAGIGKGQEGYVFTLTDGAVWLQTDGMYIDKPKIGQPIKIKRAALGSFMAKVNGGNAIRVKRDNR